MLNLKIQKTSTLDSAQILNSLIIGEIDGHAVMINPTDPIEVVGRMLGTYSKSDARKMRKLLAAAGMRNFAAAPRVCLQVQMAKAA